MATKNLKLNIHRPGVEGIGDVITFINPEKDNLRIPRRYPFVDIANLTSLRTAGYFRHDANASGVYEVSSDLGGSADTNTEGVLGFQLPNTEKLILLIKQTGMATNHVKVYDAATPPAVASVTEIAGTPAISFTIKGSLRNPFDDVVVNIPADTTFTSGTRFYEVDLYNFGQYITGVTGEDGISIYPFNYYFQYLSTDEDYVSAATVIPAEKSELEFALIARKG